MDQGFNGRCFSCGRWGHKAADHRDNRTGGAQPVDRQGTGHDQQEELVLYSLPLGQDTGGPLGGIMNPPPAIDNDQQQQQAYQPQPQEQAVGRNFGGVPEETASEAAEVRQRFFDGLSLTGSASIPGSTSSGGRSPAQSEEQNDLEVEGFLASRAQAKKRMKNATTARQLDINSIPILRRHAPTEPPRPQGQAGRGSPPGARNAEPNRAGSSLLGDYRVRRGDGSPGQQLRRQRRASWLRRPDEDEGPRADIPMDVSGSEPVQGQETRGRGGDNEQVEIDNHVDEASRVGSAERPRDFTMHRTARQYALRAGQVMGTNLRADEMHSLIDDVVGAGPPGALYHVEITPMSAEDRAAPTIIRGSSGSVLGFNKEDGAASSEEVKGRFVDAILAPADPFAFDPSLGRMESRTPTDAADRPAYQTVEDQVREEADDDTEYKQETK